MSRSKHTEAAMIAALQEVEAGREAEDVAREQVFCKHTVYAWEGKYGGMEVSEAEDVKHLRDENGRLKKLVADLSLDKDMLQSVIRKNSLGSHPATWTRCRGPRRRTKGRSEALAGAIPSQRAPRLRADGRAENDIPLQELPR
jgi:putative transposase